MEHHGFHHALKIVKDACIGCSHCMKVCPTEAIRVRNGKAELTDDRCVDCGMCYRVCPVSAIIIEQDDFNRIFDFTCRVALVPAVFLGQFPESITTEQVFDELIKLGFTHVFELEHGAGIIRSRMEEMLNSEATEKPLISSFCPAIVRLIQVKFPALVPHISHLKAPLDVAAIWYKNLLTSQGFQPEKTGIFYITPCAAKIAAVKSPVGEENSPIDGVINMDTLFNKTYRNLRAQKESENPLSSSLQPMPGNVLWSTTRGECNYPEKRCLAVDEIHNVMEFLEKLENDEITDIDFLELRACDESCAGGVLTNANRFLTVERLLKRASQKNQTAENPISLPEDLANDNTLMVSAIAPRSMHKLDENMAEALRKMNRINELMKALPGVDCGVCGAPNCMALAEDIVQNKARLAHCIFVQRIQEQKGILTEKESIELMKQIWGAGKMNK